MHRQYPYHCIEQVDERPVLRGYQVTDLLTGWNKLMLTLKA